MPTNPADTPQPPHADGTSSRLNLNEIEWPELPPVPPEPPPAIAPAAAPPTPRPVPAAAPGPKMPVNIDPADEEVAWRGYSGWAMLPSFLLCFLLTLLLLPGRWFLDDWRGVTNEVGTFALFGTTAALWIFQVVRWGYRAITYTYRLTNRHLYVDHGFLYRPEVAIDLARVAGVKWGGNPLGHLLRVGWVEVTLDGDSQPVLLTGVSRPLRFADALRTHAKEAREQSVGAYTVKL